MILVSVVVLNPDSRRIYVPLDESTWNIHKHKFNFDFHGGILPTKSLIPDGIRFTKCWFKEEEKNILAKNLPKITYPLFNQFSFDQLMATKRSIKGRFFFALGS